MRTVWVGSLILAAATVSACGAWNTTLSPQVAIETGSRCERIALPGGGRDLGVEDIDQDPLTGAVFLSGADWAGAVRGAAAPGAIFKLVRAPDGNLTAQDVTPAMSIPLWPHGLDVYRSSDGAQARLFVVNHQNAGPSRIEVFDIGSDGRLVWSEADSGAHPGLDRPNDVAATGPRSFYATNDHAAARRGWMPGPVEIAEDAIAARTARVIYVDLAQKVSKTAAKAAFPNGVQVSTDGKTVYVGELTRSAVRVFRVRSNATLKPIGRLKTGRMPDNLHLQDNRWLWVAAHGDALSFRDHAVSWKNASPTHPPAPGQVARFDLDRPGSPPTIVHASTKTSIAKRSGASAVSVGVPTPGGVLLGSIYQGVWRCLA